MVIHLNNKKFNTKEKEKEDESFYITLMLLYHCENNDYLWLILHLLISYINLFQYYHIFAIILDYI